MCAAANVLRQHQYPAKQRAIMSVSSVDLIERTLGKINERLEELIEECAIVDLEDAHRILKSDLSSHPTS